ncbi:MAG: DUF2950 family protein [Planctomycetota bacterium]
MNFPRGPRPGAGFTLIELMIVIAIIAIIAAIAIPSMLKSRISANENAAAASLKTINGMMVVFRTKGYNCLPGHYLRGTGGPATNRGKFCALFYEDNNAGQQVSLISLADAMADCRADGDTAANAGAVGSYVPVQKTTGPIVYGTPTTFRLAAKQGFWYALCIERMNNYTYDNTCAKLHFGFVAFPGDYGSTGECIFVMNEEGIAYGQDFGVSHFRAYPESPNSEGWAEVR